MYNYVKDIILEKHYQDIYPAELELKKANIGNSCVSFLDIFTIEI